ncbi:MAG TPA: carboxypeptidase-like regulatory domain-containing protein [Verrucomicrobiae bacterium]|nr:carboxypeptidase-like regulatory domain-containing protein [Verrucomicrobiae bacterium]
MKTFIGMFALLAMLVLAGLVMHPASAFTSGGLSGTILDASGHPVQGAPVSIFRLPLHRVDRAVATVQTNKNGFFAKLPLEPGRYMLTVAVSGNLAACQVHDVFNDTMTPVKMRLEQMAACKGARLHTAMVNSAIGSSFYLVH